MRKMSYAPWWLATKTHDVFPFSPRELRFSLPSTVTFSSEALMIIFAHQREAKVPHQSGRVIMPEAIKNAEQTAQQFADNSNSELSKIVSADQGQFSIENRDENTQHIKKVRVVTTVTYALKD